MKDFWKNEWLLTEERNNVNDSRFHTRNCGGWWQRGGVAHFPVLKVKNFKPRILYPVKIFFWNGGESILIWVGSPRASADCQHLFWSNDTDFRFLASRTMREQIPIVLGCQICASFLQQPQKANPVGLYFFPDLRSFQTLFLWILPVLLSFFPLLLGLQ